MYKNIMSETLQHARSLRRSGKGADALPGLIEALKNVACLKDKTPYQVEIAACYKALGRFDEAIPYYRDILISRPNDVPSLIKLGFCLRFTGAVEESRTSFEKALDLSPNNPRALRGLGILWEKRDKKKYHLPEPVLQALLLRKDGKIEEALDIVSREIKNQPENQRAPYHIAIGDCMKVMKDFVRAGVHYRIALENDPYNPFTLTSLGYCILRDPNVGSLEESETLLKRAFAMNPYNKIAINGLEEIGSRKHHATTQPTPAPQQERQEAIKAAATIEELEKQIRKFPRQVGYRERLLVLFIRAGKKVEARDCAKVILEIDTYNAPAKKFLGSNPSPT